jgi:hypothetical protein
MREAWQIAAAKEDDLFLHRVSQAAREAILLSDGPQLLCRALRGAFPGLAADSLRSEANDARTYTIADTWRRSPLDLALPEPHPVDFDWRFDAATAEWLARSTSMQGRVLCLGTPTVFEAIAAQGGRAHLIDWNPLLGDYLPRNERCSFQIADLNKELEIDGQFDAVVLDPPWYSDFYNLWFAQALSLLTRPGMLFVTLFRELTRPGADRDRAELLSHLSTFGSATILETDAVYATPRFEAEVLAHLQLPGLPAWRAADIVRVDVHREVAHLPFVSCPMKDGLIWQRFVVGNQVVALKHHVSDFGPISYSPPRPLNDSFMLTNVSRRDPHREGVTVWTSRNRAAIATGTCRIATLLQMISSKASSLPMDPHFIVDEDRRTFAQLIHDLGLEA